MNKKTVFQIIQTSTIFAGVVFAFGPVALPEYTKLLAGLSGSFVLFGCAYCFYNLSDDLDTKNGGGR